MACYNPNFAVRLFKGSDGKWTVKFLPKTPGRDILFYRTRYGKDFMLIPCGKCLACQFDKARDWATRCYCESLYHDDNCFLTLTYDNRHYPGRVVKSHIKKFIKDLRNRGHKFLYLGCAENGSITHRYHFHLLLFGYRPSDLEFYSKGTGGDSLYISKYLKDVWNRGFVIVGDVTYASAGYVARYTTKKIGDDGSYLFCSNRPAIGYQYVVDHAEQLLRDGKVIGSFGDSNSAPVPKYFDKYLRWYDPDRYESLVQKRIEVSYIYDSANQVNHGFRYPEQMSDLDSMVLDRKLSRIGRNY